MTHQKRVLGEGVSMADRVAIKKSIRFEVFKRDSFKCQYCGKAAPEVVLHVDHIKPVADGGGSDIMNLITACADCNLGKGARRLDDTSAVQKQRLQLEELQERRDQLDMLIQWRDELDEMKDCVLELFSEHFSKKMKCDLTEIGKKMARQVIREYGITLALEALDIASEKSSFEGGRVSYIRGICSALVQQREKPYLKDLFYIRGIIRHRLWQYKYVQREVLPFLEDAYLSGWTIDDLKREAALAKSWDHFVSTINSEGR